MVAFKLVHPIVNFGHLNCVSSFSVCKRNQQSLRMVAHCLVSLFGVCGWF